MTKGIKCMSWEGDERDITSNPKERRWEISTDGRIWPCCKFIPYVHSQLDSKSLKDKKLDTLINQDPDWNNIYKHDIKDIINHWAYSEYIHPRGWNSESPPDICSRLCGNKKNKTKDSNAADNFNRLNNK